MICRIYFDANTLMLADCSQGNSSEIMRFVVMFKVLTVAVKNVPLKVLINAPGRK